MWTICKRVTFEAKHRLFLIDKTDEENKKIFGKCFQDHGHSYKLYIYLRTDKLVNGMVRNFTEVKEIFKQYIEPDFDHNKPIEEILNELSTAENISKFLYYKFKQYIPEVFKIRVWETEMGYAEYEENDTN